MKPAFLRVSPVNVNGNGGQRLMVVLKTSGCEYARKSNGGCTVCGFLNHAREDITGDDMVAQLEYSLKSTNFDGIREIDLLTLGSFLNDREVNENTRRLLLSRLSDIKRIERISFESRVEYITMEKLIESKKIIGDKTVELGIGLESADDYVRNQIIKKGLSKKNFEKAVQILKQAGYELLVYLLIKPPYLSEADAVKDAINSTKYIAEVASRYDINARIAFEPVFICENTVLESLYKKAKYRLVNLWSIVDIIISAAQYQGNIFVGLSDENLSFDRMPHSCHLCNNKIVEEIEKFNYTQDAEPLNKLDCECKKEYIANLERGKL